MVELGAGSTVEAAARRLCKARVVWVAARADVAAVGLLLKIRLGRHSLHAKLLAEDEADALADASPGDVLVEVAGDAPRFRIEGLRRRAAARGLAVVLIGPPVGSDSDPPLDLHIAVPAGKTGDEVLAGQILGAMALASTIAGLGPRTPSP